MNCQGECPSNEVLTPVITVLILMVLMDVVAASKTSVYHVSVRVRQGKLDGQIDA